MRIGIVAALVLINIIIFSLGVPHPLTVSFLDIGQGDSVLIKGPTGVELLVDGGPNTAVLRELGKQLSFFDRSIDGVVATHPDADHIGGLSYVFDRYEVGTFFEPGVLKETGVTAKLEAAVEKEGSMRIAARRGMRILLGGGAYADVLYPDRDVSNVSDTNAGSIVLRVVYGENEFMLTGDAPKNVEQHLVLTDGSALQSDVLKAGHHGSKTSSLESFVRRVDPEYVVYSRGCNNKYGHPASETVAIFERLHIPALDTCESGTITFRSNGKTLWVER